MKNFRHFFVICVLSTIFLFISFSEGMSQPLQFDIIDCDAFGGTFVLGQAETIGRPCDCYEHTEQNLLILRNGNVWRAYGGDCASFVENGGIQDLFSVLIDDCDPTNDDLTCGSFANIVYPSDVPTLPQWSLIIFGLMILNIGIAFLVKYKKTLWQTS